MKIQIHPSIRPLAASHDRLTQAEQRTRSVSRVSPCQTWCWGGSFLLIYRLPLFGFFKHPTLLFRIMYSTSTTWSAFSILSLSNLLRLSLFDQSCVNHQKPSEAPWHRPHLQRWFAAKRIWSRSSTITVQQEDLVWGNHCNAYQCGLVGHRYQQISCSLPQLQLL